MQAPHPALSRHRTARLIAWALALLTWIAGLDHATPADRRRVRQRGSFFDPDKLARMVRDLILIRAAAIAKPTPVHRLPSRGAPKRNVHMRRAAAGSRLRRVLNHTDPIERVARLMAALRNIDSYARQLARRPKRGLTRLAPRLAKPRASDALRQRAIFAPFAADSS